ncbi:MULTISPECIES: hypothetical protein [Kytococcus]|nr:MULTISPECIES: hypothetical protein [Kytococcus]
MHGGAELVALPDADGTEQVTFWVNPWQESEADAVEVTRPVHDRRRNRGR